MIFTHLIKKFAKAVKSIELKSKNLAILLSNNFTIHFENPYFFISSPKNFEINLRVIIFVNDKILYHKIKYFIIDKITKKNFFCKEKFY
jgi:hypothetical protein